MDTVEIQTPAEDWKKLPVGEYAIVELFGHTTLVGRIAEVERFGTKMLAIEPMFAGELLSTVFHGGAAIYRLTPCSAQIAWERQPKQDYQLPPTIRAIVPAALLAAPTPSPSYDDRRCPTCGEIGGHDDSCPLGDTDDDDLPL